MPYSPEVIQEALDHLVTDGRVEREDGQAGGASIRGDACYRASNFAIPVGSSAGWEAAVFDHYEAMALAIGAKVSAGAPRSSANDTVGGATLTS